MATELFNRLKVENRIELCKLILNKYLEYRNWNDVADYFLVSDITIRKYAYDTNESDEEVLELKKEVKRVIENKDFRTLGNKAQRDKNRRRSNQFLKENCPRIIEYREFLNLLCSEKNQCYSLSTEEWLKVAKEESIKVEMDL